MEEDLKPSEAPSIIEPLDDDPDQEPGLCIPLAS
jgi:hypothetical protein